MERVALDSLAALNDSVEPIVSLEEDSQASSHESTIGGAVPPLTEIHTAARFDESDTAFGPNILDSGSNSGQLNHLDALESTFPVQPTSLDPNTLGLRNDPFLSAHAPLADLPPVMNLTSPTASHYMRPSAAYNGPGGNETNASYSSSSAFYTPILPSDPTSFAAPIQSTSPSASFWSDFLRSSFTEPATDDLYAWLTQEAGSEGDGNSIADALNDHSKNFSTSGSGIALEGIDFNTRASFGKSHSTLNQSWVRVQSTTNVRYSLIKSAPFRNHFRWYTIHSLRTRALIFMDSIMTVRRMTSLVLIDSLELRLRTIS